MSSVETRVLDAAKACCERWGFEKVTIDDIAASARVSRATIYRMFPGGKDVLFEALRVRELERFFALLLDRVEGATNLEDLLVRAVVAATAELRADEHLALMLASEPGRTISQLTVEGLPRIIRFANAFLAPLVEPYLDREQSRAVIDVLARLTISYFLAPSDAVDLGDDESARAFLAPVPHPLPHPRSLSMTVTHRDNDEIIGRDELDDIEAILAVSNQDLDEVEHAVKDNADAMFTWDYSLARPQLRKLYEKAKTGQWNATTDLPWDTEVDLEAGRRLATRRRSRPASAPTTTTARSSRSGTTSSGSSSASISAAGPCPSSSTASRAPCSARRRSPRPCRGTTPSCTPPRR